MESRQGESVELGVGSPSFAREAFTLMDCREVGHCSHEGTAVGAFYCCRCGAYLFSLGFPLQCVPLLNWNFEIGQASLGG